MTIHYDHSNKRIPEIYDLVVKSLLARRTSMSCLTLCHHRRSLWHSTSQFPNPETKNYFQTRLFQKRMGPGLDYRCMCSFCSHGIRRGLLVLGVKMGHRTSNNRFGSGYASRGLFAFWSCHRGIMPLNRAGLVSFGHPRVRQ